MTGRTVKVQGSDIGPGHYESQYEFGSDTKKITIGERRPEKERESIGPGLYDVESADRHVKENPRSVDFAAQKGRIERDIISQIGPGEYHKPKSMAYWCWWWRGSLGPAPRRRRSPVSIGPARAAPPGATGCSA